MKKLISLTAALALLAACAPAPSPGPESGTGSAGAPGGTQEKQTPQTPEPTGGSTSPSGSYTPRPTFRANRVAGPDWDAANTTGYCSPDDPCDGDALFENETEARACFLIVQSPETQIAAFCLNAGDFRVVRTPWRSCYYAKADGTEPPLAPCSADGNHWVLVKRP